MSRPWMPLYIADYLKDTTHLGALESGAYLHLIMDYWVNGRLPDDEKRLARIAKMTDREWKAAKPTLQSFFHDGWRHKRIDAEIAHSAEVSAARKKAVGAREQKKRSEDIKSSSDDTSIDTSNDDTLHTSHFTEERKIGADAPAGKVVSLGFDGQATHWDQKTITRWRRDFPAIDLEATLRMIDAYYVEHPREDGKYFFPAQKWLEKENREAPQRAKQAARDRGDAW